MPTVSPDLLHKIASHYDVLSLLGEGGMGTVYRIRHRHLDEIRVAKIMHQSLRHNSQLAQRFHREAQLLSGLRHPNIAQIFEFFVNDDGAAAIIMEWVPGEDLRRLSRRLGPVPLDIGLEIGRQTLLALEHLHAQQYVHRDISPDNLMISWSNDGDAPGPKVKMIDLGIAKALDETAGMTATGNFLGKVRYSSPERLSPDGRLDPRSDLYSLAIVLYEILTGICPIRGKTPEALISGHLFHHPRPFEEADPEGRVPTEVRRVLMDLLAKNPDDRPASAAELIPDWLALQAACPPDAERAAAWGSRILTDSKVGAGEAGDDDETLSIPPTVDSALDPDQELGTTLLGAGSVPSAKSWSSQQGRIPRRHGRRETVLIWGVGLVALALLALVVWWISADRSTPAASAPVGSAVDRQVEPRPSAGAPTVSPIDDQPISDSTAGPDSLAPAGRQAALPPALEDSSASSRRTPTTTIDSLESGQAELDPAEPSPAKPSPAEPNPAELNPAEPSSGLLLLSATPWAEVTSITNASGRTVPLPEDRSTPLAMNLLLDRYEVEMSNGSLGQSRRITVDVTTAAVNRGEVEFEKVDADALLRSLGW